MYRILRRMSALATKKRNAKRSTSFGSATDWDHNDFPPERFKWLNDLRCRRSCVRSLACATSPEWRGLRNYRRGACFHESDVVKNPCPLSTSVFHTFVYIYFYYYFIHNELFVGRDSAISNRWRSRSCRNQKIEGNQIFPVVWQNNSQACLKWVYTLCLVLRTNQQ